MRIVLDITKTVEENAGIYYDKSKKMKKKKKGAIESVEVMKKKLAKLEQKKEKEEINKKEVIKRKKQWYEKFKWFYTSKNHLVIAGRDATTNDIIIKKHVEQNDIIFHSEMSGSPFCVLKLEGDKVDEIELKEVAQFCAVNSKAFKLGIGHLDVFYVNPDQVTKSAPAGEYMSKGSFMIYGKKNIITSDCYIYVGLKDGVPMSGPLTVMEKHCPKWIKIVQGRLKKSDAAKKIKKLLEEDEVIDLDDFMAVLPTGGIDLER